MAMAKDSSVLRGKLDDGYGRPGVVLTKSAQGKLIKLPFSSSVATGTDGTAGTVTINPTVGQNPDGSNKVIQLSVTAGVNGFAYVEQTIWGRVVGIRWRRNVLTALAPFAVIVDGVVHKVGRVKNQSNFGDSAQVDYEAQRIVVEDLPPGPHTARVLLSSDAAASGAVTRTISFFGWITEADKGYEPPRQSGISSGATVPTASTAVATTLTLTNALVRKLHFYNTNATTAHTVTVLISSSVFKVIAIPAQTHAEVDLGSPPMNTTNLNWKVDAGTDVTGFAQVEGSIL